MLYYFPKVCYLFFGMYIFIIVYLLRGVRAMFLVDSGGEKNFCVF